MPYCMFLNQETTYLYKQCRSRSIRLHTEGLQSMIPYYASYSTEALIKTGKACAGQRIFNDRLHDIIIKDRPTPTNLTHMQ